MRHFFFYKSFSTINLKCIALVGESDQTCNVVIVVVVVVVVIVIVAAAAAAAATAIVIIIVILIIVIIIVPNLGQRMYNL